MCRKTKRGDPQPVKYSLNLLFFREGCEIRARSHGPRVTSPVLNKRNVKRGESPLFN